MQHRPGLRVPLVALFFFSGVAGLVYEIVWLRMFARTLGCTSYATSTVLAAFMGGLALGGFAFGRLSDRPSCRHLRLYALLELLIGACALALPALLTALLPLYHWLHDVTAGSYWPMTIAKAGLLFACILVPTTLMGGTLPVISVFLTRNLGQFGRNLSLLYAWNTLGAVVGVTATAFLFIDFLGEWGALSIGIAINLFIAATAWALDRRRGPGGATGEIESSDEATVARSQETDVPTNLVLVAIFLSGFTALAYEVIWSRQLVLYMATSVYAFASMLTVFLIGIALGSHVLFRYLDRAGRPLVLLAAIQFAVSGFSILGLYLFPRLGSADRSTLLDSPATLLATFVLLFPVAFCFGMTFPTAAKCLVARDRIGASLGRLYAANTLGNILGASAAGFVLIPIVGSANSMLGLIVANLLIGLALLAHVQGLGAKKPALAGSAVLVCGVSLFAFVGRDPFFGLIERRVKFLSQGSYEILDNLEGVEGTVTAFRIVADEDAPWAHRYKRLWLNGTGMTMLGDETKLMAHLPIMLAPDPKSMLVICFGMGSTVKTAYAYPDLHITAVELVEEMYRCFARFHDPGLAAEILASERVDTVVGDGRNYLLMTNREFDIIVIDPAPPIYSAGTVNLYTREFLELCKSRLTGEGVMCYWLPKGSRAEVLGICKTFVEVFPNTNVWSGPSFWGLYLIGLPEGAVYRPEQIDRGFEEHPGIAADMAQYSGRTWTAQDVHDLYLWNAEELRLEVAEGVVVTDGYPHTEFPLFEDRAFVEFEEQAAMSEAQRRERRGGVER